MKFSKQDTNIAKTIAIIAMYIHHLFFSKEKYGKRSTTRCLPK